MNDFIPVRIEDAARILAGITDGHRVIAKVFQSGMLAEDQNTEMWGSLMGILAQLEFGAVVAIQQHLIKSQSIPS